MLRRILNFALACLALTLAAHGSARAQDPRNIRNGLVLPDESYCDQPYVVRTADGAWLCVMTTGSKHEGSGGQHVIATRSKDHGRTWSKPVDIEPASGPVASWGMPLVTPYGRVYVFYSYNGDAITGRRADMLGWYCYRYSDDHGRTWSSDRHRLPVRVTAADRGNDWKGEVQIFWGIGKPIVVGDDAIFAFTKIGKYMLDQSEGWFFRSPNILRERDVRKLRWTMLPQGDYGLRAPAHGSIQSEQNLVPLPNGDLYCMYRTRMGYPCHAYSRDGGKTWTKPEAASYSPGGRRFKHPRACPRIWKTRAGRYLFWFHNNGEKDWSPGTRNPCWLAGGVERDGKIHWSQPEIVLYDPDPKVRISYPDLIEEGDTEQAKRTWITETQKSVARVHEIDPTLLAGLWTQGVLAHVIKRGLVDADDAQLPELGSGGGWSLELRFTLADDKPRVLVASKPAEGGRAALTLEFRDGALTLRVRSATHEAVYSCDRSRIQIGREHHVVVTVDGEPRIVTWLIDAVLCDGGKARTRGWQRFEEGEETRVEKRISSTLAAATHAASGRGFEAKSALRVLRVYARALRSSEAIANFHAKR